MANKCIGLKCAGSCAESSFATEWLIPVSHCFGHWRFPSSMSSSKRLMSQCLRCGAMLRRSRRLSPSVPLADVLFIFLMALSYCAKLMGSSGKLPFGTNLFTKAVTLSHLSGGTSSSVSHFGRQCSMRLWSRDGVSTVKTRWFRCQLACLSAVHKCM